MYDCERLNSGLNVIMPIKSFYHLIHSYTMLLIQGCEPKIADPSTRDPEFEGHQQKTAR